MRTYSAASVAIEKSLARRSPAWRNASASSGSSSTSPSAVVSAPTSPGWTSRASTPSVATLRYPSRALATTVVSAAIASISTTPNDSPWRDGRAEHRRAAQAGELLGVADPAEPRDPGVGGVGGLQRRAVGPVAGDPQPGVRGQLGERGEQHGQPLALLVATAEEDRRAVGRRRLGRRDHRFLHAVEQDVVVAAEVATGPAPARPSIPRPCGRCGRPATAGSAGRSCSSTTPRRRWNVPTSGAGCISTVVIGGPGASGSCTWTTSNSSSRERPDRPQRGRGVGRQRGDRSVGRRRQAVAERRDERLGRRAVAGPEHPRLVALAAQLPGQPQHLGLHAARHGQAVGAHEADAQGPARRRHGTPP